MGAQQGGGAVSDERVTASTGGLVGEAAGPEGWREHLERVLQEWLGPPLKQVQELERRVEELGSRVQRLEERLGGRRTEKEEERPVWTEAAGFNYLDPYEIWIEQHREELTRYRDCYVAIHPKKGLVLHDPDEDEFYRKLRELHDRDHQALESLLTTHMSLYAWDEVGAP